jgi:hypothetical protein
MFNPGSVGPRRFMLPIVSIQQVSAVTAWPNGFEAGAPTDQLKQRHTPLPT